MQQIRRSAGSSALWLCVAALWLTLQAARADEGEHPAASDSKSQLEAVQQAMDKSHQQAQALQRQAQTVAAEIANLQDASVAAARIAQENEAALSADQLQIRSLQRAMADKIAAIAATHGRESKLLAALQRVAIEPPAALVFAPGSPLDSLRGGMLLGAIVPQLRAEALKLDVQLTDLERLRSATEAKKAEASERQILLTGEEEHLAQLMTRKRALETSTRRAAMIEQRRLTALALQASDLKDLIRKLDAERQKQLAAQAAAARRQAAEAAVARKPATVPPAGKESPPSHAQELAAGGMSLYWPAEGRLLKRFGQSDGFITTKGLTIATRPGATVVSPFGGQILFAGPFHGYGQILIIEHPGGYDSLLAGCDHIDSVVGQWVEAGEPVARMRTGAGTPNLYFELRYKDQPVDPSPWMPAP